MRSQGPGALLGDRYLRRRDRVLQGLGASDVAGATRLVDLCLAAGLNLFDSADIYSNGLAEEILGKAIQGRRHQVILSTKGGQRAGAGPNEVGSSRVVDVLDAVAAETGKSVPQIALNWLLQRPTIASVIIGARDEAQLRDNLGAVGWNLTAGQVARLDATSATTPIYPYWHQWQFKERNPTPVG